MTRLAGCASVRELTMVAGVCPSPVQFDAIDGEPVRLFFLIVGPEASAGLHVKILSRIARLVRRDSVRQQLIEATTADAFYNVLLDAALLKHEYPVEVIPGGPSTYPKTVLVGRLCDPLDIFPTSSRSKLGGAEAGKLVVFRDVGAYSIVMNMPFHSQPKPSVLMRNAHGNYVMVRERQDVHALFLEEGGNLLD